jgi:eukaryotic-like serine/threonine-protein kinase
MEIEHFAPLLVKSGLSSPHESEALIESFRSESRKSGKAETVEALCEFLIATGLFTEWQCGKLLQGKYKGFYLDNFLMLEQCGKDDRTSSYKARDARDGKLVCLIVTPPMYTDKPYIDYRVEPFDPARHIF